MVGRPLLSIALFGFMIGSLATGQEVHQGNHEPGIVGDLVLKEEVALPGQYSGVFSAQMQCDSEGNVYVRQPAPGWRDPILKLRPDGEVVKYSVAEVPVDRLQPQGGGLAYFVARDGEVHQIAQVPRTYEIYVVRWKKDGSFGGSTRLEARFAPNGPLAVFPSGEIVVSGFAPHDSDLPRDTPMTLLFDKEGRLVRELVLEGDRYDERHTEATEQQQEEDRTKQRSAVSLGDAVIGTDGNLYLLRRSLPARVFVLSPNGELVRTLTVESGDPELLPAKLAERDGKVAVFLYNFEQPETVLVVADAHTGQTLERYTVERKLGRAFACYEKEGFTFFLRRGRNIGLLRAGPL